MGRGGPGCARWGRGPAGEGGWPLFAGCVGPSVLAVRGRWAGEASGEEGWVVGAAVSQMRHGVCVCRGVGRRGAILPAESATAASSEADGGQPATSPGLHGGGPARALDAAAVDRDISQAGFQARDGRVAEEARLIIASLRPSLATVAPLMVSWECLQIGVHRMRDTICLVQSNWYWPLFKDMSRGTRESGNRRGKRTARLRYLCNRCLLIVSVAGSLRQLMK